MKVFKLIALCTVLAVGPFTFLGSASANTKPEKSGSKDSHIDSGYYVIREGSKLRMKFKRNVQVMVHTSRQYAPYIITWGNPKKDLLISSGQWVHVKVNGTWAFAVDADNRP